MFDKIIRYWLASMGIIVGSSIILLFCGLADIAITGFILYSILLALGLIIGSIIGLIKH